MSGCRPEEIALKSFFLGPQAENGDWFRFEVDRILRAFIEWRKSRFPSDGAAISPTDLATPEFVEQRHLFHARITYLLTLLEAETPKFTPRYMGHMVSEVSLPALLGHFVTLLHNPNNASKEVARMTSVIEKEAIQALATMVGYDRNARGHFTSGGTVANFEALYRARNALDLRIATRAFLKTIGKWDGDLFDASHGVGGIEEVPYPDLVPFSAVFGNPFAAATRISEIFNVEYRGPVILVPGNKHYSWQKAVSLLGLGNDAFWSIPLDRQGRLDVGQAEKLIQRAKKEKRPIAAVVSVAGTTEMGEFDPVDRVQDLIENLTLDIWHHADAAYGGFYCTLLDNGKSQILPDSVVSALNGLKRLSSITIDPHKLGYVPYSCGAFLARNSELYQTSPVSAPYLEGTQNNGSWANTLEGSRPGSGAVATWLSAECLGLRPDGYGKILERGILARRKMEASLKARIPQVRFAPGGECNVLCFVVAFEGEKLSQVNKRTLRIFRELDRGNEFSVSRTRLHYKDYTALFDNLLEEWKGPKDEEDLSLIRMVLMNPFTTSKEMKVNFFEAFAALVDGLVRGHHSSL